MNRRTKGVLLVGCLAVATFVALAVAPSVALSVALARGLAHNRCEIGLRSLIIGCTFKASRTVTTAPSGFVDETSWDLSNHCPLGDTARRLLCASAPASASDDLEMEVSKANGLPLPKGRVLTTEKNSRFIKSVHVETPLELAAVLGSYRAELDKRGWTENAGAVVEPDRAVIAFTTSDGPALLRLAHQDNRTVADLSLRKPAPANAAILPTPGQVRLRLGNDTDEEAVITINEQTIKLAARAGRRLTGHPETGRKAPDSPEIDLPPGKYKVVLKVASGAAQNREFEVAAGETWGLLVGPAGVPLPVQLY